VTIKKVTLPLLERKTYTYFTPMANNGAFFDIPAVLIFNPSNTPKNLVVFDDLSFRPGII
tara:strand:- start:111 stop:290 length:180 start_codon:yes stop_codon:yes gene_type:complete